MSPAEQFLRRSFADVSGLLLDHPLCLEVGEQDVLKVVHQEADDTVVQVMSDVSNLLPQSMDLPGAVPNAVLYQQPLEPQSKLKIYKPIQNTISLITLPGDSTSTFADCTSQNLILKLQ